MIHRIHFINLEQELQKPLQELEEFLGFQITDDATADIYVTINHSIHDLKLVIDDNQVQLHFHRRVEFFRGIGLLVEYLSTSRAEGHHEINEKPSFTNLTYMQDNSRNAVSKPEALYRMIKSLALMGFHSMMLYTEDTYELEGYPFFGYMRGRFTKEELQGIDAYAKMFGIELIPCIQTLAHLNAAFRWWAFDEVRDLNDILLCGEPKTYEFIEAMVKTCAQNFTSRKINIGMDEAEMLGLGKYLKRHGYQERFQIILEHLKKVLAICDQYDMQPMMWSDMFFKLLSDNTDYYADVPISEEIQAMIPKNVKLIYWDYYSREKGIYDSMLHRHKKLSDQIAFAGGAWRWTGFAPLLGHSIGASKLALESCIEHGIQDVLVTCWGDDGSETSTFAVGPVLQQYAEYCYTQSFSEERLAKRLDTCTHMNYEDFRKLDLFNLTPDNLAPGFIAIAPSRYLFYQDLVMGIFDQHVDELTYPKHYHDCYVLLSKIATKDNEYSYIFDTLAKLAHVLSLKSDMGIRIKKAYDNKALEDLRRIATEECRELLDRIQVFHEALRMQWYRESKPFGFEVLDLRIGGLKERVKAAAMRIEDYLDGRVDRLEELEEERLVLDSTVNPGHRTRPVYCNDWRNMVTVSVL